jgi:hypothetical protein
MNIYVLKFSHQKSFLELFVVTLVLSITSPSCESEDRFYRPDLPEKLCCIAVIDIDDTVNYDRLPYPFDARVDPRYIYFEKSFQSEYVSGSRDSLRELSFSISSANSELLNYETDRDVEFYKGFKILPGPTFQSGERYFLKAREGTTEEIHSVAEVPVSPPEINLISIVNETRDLEPPRGNFDFAFTSVIDISFRCDFLKKQYFMVMLEGYGGNLSSSVPITYSNISFSIIKSNTPVFSVDIPSFTMYQLNVNTMPYSYDTVPVPAYFIEGGDTQGDSCNLRISVSSHDGVSPFEFVMFYRIKLMSIPKDFYDFQKSRYLYRKVEKDPFAEPIYLNGNIQNGNGIFVLCRSKEINIRNPFLINLNPQKKK